MVARTKVARKKNDIWFKKVRGSYLPISWQSRSLYFLAIVYIVAPFVSDIRNEVSILSLSIGFATRLLLVGVVLTVVAQQKS